MMRRAIMVILVGLIICNISLVAEANSIEFDFYQVFEEHGSIMLLVDSRTGDIEYVNRAASDFYGYSVEQLESMKIHEMSILTPEEIGERMQAAAKGEEGYYTLEQRLASGDTRIVEIYVCPHSYGDKTVLFAIVHDITERMQPEKKNGLMNNVLLFALSGIAVSIGLFSLLLFMNLKKLKMRNHEIQNLNELRRTFIDAGNSLIYLKDENYKYIFANRALMNFYQKEESEVIGYEDLDLVDEEYANLAGKLDVNVLEKKAMVIDKFKWKNKIYQATKFPVKLINGHYGVGAFVNEITAEYNNKRRLEEMNAALNKSNVLLSAILESSPEIIVFALDTKYCYLSFNSKHKETMRKIWGKEIEIGMSMLEVIGSHDDCIKSRRNFDKALSGKSFTLIEEYGDDKLLRRVWQNYYAPIYSNDGKIMGLTCFVLDITDQKEAEEEVIYLSYRDKLTELYNRRFFEEELRRLDIERNLPISVIVADMNGLKLANDIFGHDSGDLLLKKAAKAFKKVCRADDIIARVGGDEFNILLPKTKEEEAKGIILRIKNQFSKERVKSIKGGISMGCATKNHVNEDILETLKNAENKMYATKTLDRNDAKGSTIKAIAKTLHESSPREEKHAKNVSRLCGNIGKTMNLSELEIRRLKEAGFLHDIGKVVLDQRLLNKNEMLTDDELKEMNCHPVAGYRILNSFDQTLDLAESILAHHERWDGSGYPKGLKGEEIPKLARIIAVAESYDEMTNSLNKKVMNKEEAVSELRKQAGSKFDPDVVDIFVKMILDNNEYHNPHFFHMPKSSNRTKIGE